MIDEETAPVVRKIFKLCIDGYGPTQIARILTEEGIPTPTAYAKSKGRNAGHPNAKLHRWGEQTIDHILEKAEYAGHTVNFRTHIKSYKSKKQIDNPKEEWVIFENTHEPIISQHDFDLVQELRKNKRRVQKCGETNPFSGMVYCADCGSKMYLCRSKYLNDDQEHLKCSAYAHDKDACTAHYIRTVVLKEIVLKELNKLLVSVKENEDMFVREFAKIMQGRSELLCLDMGRRLLDPHAILVTTLLEIIYRDRPSLYVDTPSSVLRQHPTDRFHHSSILGKEWLEGRKMCDVAGPLPMRLDHYADRCVLPVAEIGDRVVFHDVGSSVQPHAPVPTYFHREDGTVVPIKAW